MPAHRADERTSECIAERRASTRRFADRRIGRGLGAGGATAAATQRHRGAPRRTRVPRPCCGGERSDGKGWRRRTGHSAAQGCRGARRRSREPYAIEPRGDCDRTRLKGLGLSR
jgi:hypothetical protein